MDFLPKMDSYNHRNRCPSPISDTSQNMQIYNIKHNKTHQGLDKKKPPRWPHRENPKIKNQILLKNLHYSKTRWNVSHLARHESTQSVSKNSKISDGKYS